MCIRDRKYSEEVSLADHDWWVFSKVAKKLDYPIFMAHAEEIGYKRGARREEERPNQLFAYGSDGRIVIDTDNSDKILDYLRREVAWTKV